MSMVIQTTSSEQATTASDLTGRRNENIQRSNWKLVFSTTGGATGSAGSPFPAASARGGAASPFAPLEAVGGGFGADEEGGGDCVLDTAVSLRKHVTLTSPRITHNP